MLPWIHTVGADNDTTCEVLSFITPNIAVRTNDNNDNITASVVGTITAICELNLCLSNGEEGSACRCTDVYIYLPQETS